MSTNNRYAIALVAALGLFPVALDSTIVNVAIVPISTALHSSIDTIQWIYIGFMLANAAVLPLGGYLGNRFGSRRLFLLGLTAFTLMSLGCGVAPTEGWLIAFRVLQGIGGGLLMPLGMAIAMQPFAREERARAMAVVGVPLMLAPIAGPIIGGLIIDNMNWQAIFFVNAPIGALALLLALLVIPVDSLEERSPQAMAALDYPGLLLSMSGVALLVYAFKLVSQSNPGTRTAANPQGTIYGWSYWPVWALAATGVLLLVVFAYQALRVSRDPILDLRLFAQRDFTIANLTIWVGSTVMFGLLFLVPVFLQQVRQPNLSPLQTGLALLPMGIATVVGMVLGGGLYRLVGARVLVVCGALLLSVGCWLLHGITLTTSIADMSLPLALIGLSMTLVIVPTQTLALEALSGEALNKATSLVNAGKLLWASVGSAALVTTFVQHTTDHATQLLAALPTSLLAHPAAAAATAARARIAAQAATNGMTDVFSLLLWGAMLMVVMALFLPGRRVSTALTNTTPQDLYSERAISA